MDAYLLADFVKARPGQRIIDLGTGTGLVPILLATLTPGLQLTGVEIQPRLLAVARRNAEANGLTHAINFLEKDIRNIGRDLGAGSFSQVVSNPPYYKLHAARVNPSKEKALARHEVAITLREIVRAASSLLERHGTLNLVFTPARLPELLKEMEAHKITPSRLRSVHSHAAERATLVLAAGMKGSRCGLTMEQPLVIHKERGEYTAEMEALYERTSAVHWPDA